RPRHAAQPQARAPSALGGRDPPRRPAGFVQPGTGGRTGGTRRARCRRGGGQPADPRVRFPRRLPQAHRHRGQLMALRPTIVRPLVVKEAVRLAANRGALALAALLVAAAGLVAVFDRGGEQFANNPRPLTHFWVDYWRDGPWVEHLKSHVPDDLAAAVHFRPD